MFKSFIAAFSLVLLTTAAGMAQQQSTRQYTRTSDSDPEARAAVEALRRKYQAYTNMEASFTLDIELPEQPKETQRGVIGRSGPKYRMQLSGQEVICDGRALYLIMHSNKEVQINNMPDPNDDENILSPDALFNFYDRGQFVFILVDERTENGKVVQIIDCKPTDRESEFSKITLTLTKQSREIVRIKAFGKDGSRYTFNLLSLNGNKTFAGNHFTFDRTKYPGYHIEDLRD
jgi:outer membrane lipoprotein-sorting protein